MKALITIGIWICVTSLTITSKEGAKKQYVFKNKHDYSSVILFENGTFTQSAYSCTYAFSCKGHWKQKGDTITLNQEKFKKCRGNFKEYSKRADQLVLLNDRSANYLWNIRNGLGEDFAMYLKLD